MSRLIPLAIALLILSSGDLAAQRRGQPPGPWSAEIDVRTSILLDDEVIYTGARLTYELTPLFTAGLSALVLMEEATRRTHTQMETIKLLGGIGPRLEFMDTLRSRVDYFVGLSGAVGYARRRTTTSESDVTESETFLMAEPEIGLLARASRRLRLRLSLSGMVGKIETSDELIFGGPSATFGIRWSL